MASWVSDFSGAVATATPARSTASTVTVAATLASTPLDGPDTRSRTAAQAARKPCVRTGVSMKRKQSSESTRVSASAPARVT